MDAWTDEWMEEWVSLWMDGQVYGCMDELGVFFKNFKEM